MHAFARTPSVVATLLIGVGALSVSSPARADALLFEERTTNLGSPQPCADPANPNAEGCYSNDVVVADLNRDGKLDVLFANGGGFFGAQAAAPLAAYLNQGAGLLRERGATLFGGFQGHVRQVAVADIDGDGDLDVLAPDAFGLAAHALFINDGMSQPSFTNEGVKRLPQSAHASAARFGDLDGDGDLDLVITDWGATPPGSPGTVLIYTNDGSGHFAEKPGAAPRDTDAGAFAAGPVDVDLFDADGDWDLDLLVANRVGPSLLFVNDGHGSFAADPRLPPQRGPFVYGPDECDVDGDGDLDVWLDNGALGGTTQLLINDGAGHFSDETAARVVGNDVAVDDNVVRCADVNGDGALDAVIGSVGGDRRVLVNDGTGRFHAYASAFPKQSFATLGLELGDIDGDGRIDVMTAQGESGPWLNRLYVGTAAVPIDARAPLFRALERLPNGTKQGDVVVRFAVSDNATTHDGPRLSSATLETATDVVAARFVGGDLFRAVLHVPSAAVTYRACATDWAGNRSCSDSISFTPEGAAAAASDAGVDAGDATIDRDSASAVPRGSIVPLVPAGGCSCELVPTGSPFVHASSLALLIAVALRFSTRRSRRASRSDS